MGNQGSSAESARDLPGQLEAHRELWVGVPEQIQWLVAQKLRLLSGVDGVLLLTRHGESALPTGLGEVIAPDAISPALAIAALHFDPHLQAVRDRLVRPRGKLDLRRRAGGGASGSAPAPASAMLQPHAALSDATFWANYFSHVDAIKHEVGRAQRRGAARPRSRPGRPRSSLSLAARAPPCLLLPQLTLDYFRALRALHNRNQALRERWVALWEALPAGEARELRRAADGIARRSAQLDGDGGPDEACEEALGEYGERGAYEVVRVVLAAALSKGWRVGGTAERSAGGADAAGGAAREAVRGGGGCVPCAQGQPSYEEQLYRLWCCAEPLLPPGAPGPAAPSLHAERSAERLSRSASRGAPGLPSPLRSPLGSPLGSPPSPSRPASGKADGRRGVWARASLGGEGRRVGLARGGSVGGGAIASPTSLAAAQHGQGGAAEPGMPQAHP